MDKFKEIEFDEQSFQQDNLQKIENLWGIIKTVSVAPTHVPRKLDEQVLIYTNGATYRLYWYDMTNNVWHYITATA